jgi:hypothetical protein
MVHGIHATAHPNRTLPLEFVRDRGNSGLFYYAFIGDDQTAEFPGGHVVGFPGNLANCTKCHVDGFGVTDTPLNALVSTHVTNNGAITAPADVAAARASVPNSNDMVIQPILPACYSCHANQLLQGHLRSMDGRYTERRLVTG